MKWFLWLSILTVPLWGQMVIESDEARYDGSRIYLKGSVQIVSELGQVSADAATIDAIQEHGGWDTNYIMLEGHVKMMDGDHNQFALAHRVEIFPEDKVMVFEAAEGERVLFMDVARNMQLAAHKVRAQRGETDTVQGYGDVRCVFGNEELTRLKTHFSLE